MGRGGHRDCLKGEFDDGFVKAMFDTALHDMFVNFCCFWVVCGCRGWCWALCYCMGIDVYGKVREWMGWVGLRCWKIWIWRLKIRN